MFWNWNCIYTVIHKRQKDALLNILIQRVRHQNQLNNLCPRQWERAESFPAGAKGLTGCGEILDLSEMSSPPPLAMWNIWLLIMSLFPIVLSLLHVRIHPSPAELIKELEMMLQLSAIAERLSASLVIWSAAGNHPPLTLLEAFWVVLLFSSGCFGILLSLFPWASCFWMRAFLVLSTGPCQPGCSAQPSPALTTAASAKTLAQSLRMCLWSPSYRSLFLM